MSELNQFLAMLERANVQYKKYDAGSSYIFPDSIEITIYKPYDGHSDRIAGIYQFEAVTGNLISVY